MIIKTQMCVKTTKEIPQKNTCPYYFNEFLSIALKKCSLWPTELIFVPWRNGTWFYGFTQWKCTWLALSCSSCPKYSQTRLFLSVGPSHTLQNISQGAILVATQHDRRTFLWVSPWVCPEEQMLWEDKACVSSFKLLDCLLGPFPTSLPK